jgi:hypothetical protein
MYKVEVSWCPMDGGGRPEGRLILTRVSYGLCTCSDRGKGLEEEREEKGFEDQKK